MNRKFGADDELFDSRTRLILAAERLFAKCGIEGVSLRKIAAEAGQKNHHAVQYHFESRESLVQAIFDYRMEQMDARRHEMLDRARKEQRLDAADVITDIIFLPQLELISDFKDVSYPAFLSQYLLWYSDLQYGKFGGNLPPALEETLQLLRRKLGFLSDEAAQRRLMTASFMFLNMLVMYARDLADEQPGERFGDALEDTMQQIIASLFMPVDKNHAQT